MSILLSFVCGDCDGGDGDGGGATDLHLVLVLVLLDCGGVSDDDDIFIMYF